MSLDLFFANLFSPPILFFILGITATLVRSDLEVPAPLPKLFSLYLLWAIGFKGGVALREAGLTVDALTPVVAAVLLSGALALLGFLVFRRLFGFDDACALAASYGSVSVVTFVTAADFLDGRGIEYGGQMVAALALMESPPIIVALILKRLIGPGGAEAEPISAIVRGAVTSGPVFLLMGSLVAGLLTPEAALEPLKPFTYDIFAGVLVFFLLEAGMTSGQRLGELRKQGLPTIGLGIAIPIVNAAIGMGVAYLIGLGKGEALLLTILAGSASYIAVPAAMRLAVPNANSGLYLPMSLGVTFPFNVCIGIPVYLILIQAIWPEAAASP
ncbi:MAG: sodium-dependent bicarbonate transport family permease [Planctomycetota bacterium]